VALAPSPLPPLLGGSEPSRPGAPPDRRPEASPSPSPAPRASYREIPVGLADVHNQVMRDRRYLYAVRFVVDRSTPLFRFFAGFNLEGARAIGGRRGYAGGSGGRIRARLVAIDRRGRPNLRKVIASESVEAGRRYFDSARSFGILPGRTQLLYFDMGGVPLRGGRAYAMVFQNVSRRPRRNFFSMNSPTVKASEAGPNGRNTRDRRARGAIAGLDPREAVAWSTGGGRRWVWGRRVGMGRTRGSYAGSRSGDGGARLPWYGWQGSTHEEPRSNQPYYAYRRRGRFTLRLDAAPRAVTLTEAGGYAPRRRAVGRVTVTNLRTGGAGTTRHLGSGIAKGRLDRPVRIERGDSYTVENTGTVLKAEGDSFIVHVFGVGRLCCRFPFTTVDQGVDRAELFTLPHPYFENVLRSP